EGIDMQRSSERILTTHAGSLARPSDLLELMQARSTGQPYDQAGYADRLRAAVANVVRQQVDSGVDVVSDGEQSKIGFFEYLRERLAGFELRPAEPGAPSVPWVSELQAFPDFYASTRSSSGAPPAPSVVCVGPVTYQGHELLARDIENLKA